MASTDSIASAVAAKAKRSIENRATAHDLTPKQRKEVAQKVAELLV